MKNKIIKLAEKERKVFGFNDETIFTSSKKHSSFEKLVESGAKSGLLKSTKTIPVSALHKITYLDKEDAIHLTYTVKDGTKKLSLTLDDTSMREAVVTALAEMKSFQKSTAAESRTKPLLYNILGMLGVILFSWVGYTMAIESLNGTPYEPSGRRKGMILLFRKVVETLGPNGVLAAGTVAFVFMFYRLYKRYNNPASETIYS